MKILVTGGGGREHSLVWKVAQSPLVKEVIAAPGNAGMAGDARCEPISAEDVEGQVKLALREKVDLVVVGPEAPLVDGLADRLAKEGVTVFGPSASASMLEGSKLFAKRFMERHGVPTARFSSHDEVGSALAEIERLDGPCVVKADGLAAGKGVVVCGSPKKAREAVVEMMENRAFGAAGSKVVIEELLRGEEVSVLAICDGERFVPLIAAQDHKAAFDGDSGPNTGGMGAYAPAPLVSPELRDVVVEKVLKRTVAGMAADGTPFKGVLYAGMMISDGNPFVLEFNVRFGDPECQPLLAMLKEDLVPTLMNAADGKLEVKEMEWHDGAAMCVVIASKGYPGKYDKGKPIEGLETAASIPGVTVFHAGTKRIGDQMVTDGGRVLGVTARAESLARAAEVAYEAVDKIRWDGTHFRRDIGYRALK